MRNIIIAIAMGFVIAVILCWIGINFISTHPDCCFLKPGGAKVVLGEAIL